MEEGWVVCHNIGAIDSMSISCASAAYIRPPMPADYKLLLNYYFPSRSAILVYDVLDSSHHDPVGMVGALLNVFCSIFRKPWPNRHILDLETNCCTLKLILRTSVTSKILPIFPPWVLRSPLDAESIVSPTTYEGLMSEEELYHHGQMNRMIRTNRAESRRELSERKRGTTGIVTGVSRAKPDNPAKELVGEELVRVREELDYFVLPESDEEDPKRDERMDVLLDIPSILDGVSVSGFFKGSYSILFEVHIPNSSAPLSQSKKGSRPSILDELGAVEKAIRAKKQRCNREKAKENKEMEREKERDRKERLDRERKEKVTARVGDESEDGDLPFIDGISDVLVVGKKRKFKKNCISKPARCMNTAVKITNASKLTVKSHENRGVNAHPLVPSHLDLDNTPNVSPNNDSVYSQQCVRNLARPEIFQQILDGDQKLESEYRRHMAVYKPLADVFYNCMVCKNYKLNHFKRVISHSLNCVPGDTHLIHKDIPYSTLLANTDTRLSATYKKAMFCAKCDTMSNRCHYHCLKCKIYCAHVFKRVVKHGMKCKGSHSTTTDIHRKEEKQGEVVDGHQDNVQRGGFEADQGGAQGGSEWGQGSIVNEVQTKIVTGQGEAGESQVAVDNNRRKVYIGQHEVEKVRNEVGSIIQGGVESGQEDTKVDCVQHIVGSGQEHDESVQEDIDCDQEDVGIYREDVEIGQEDVESVQEDIDCDQEDVGIYREDVEMGQEDVESIQEDIDCDQEDVEIYREDVEMGQDNVESVQEDIDCDQEDVGIYREDVEIGQEDVESVQEDIDCDQEDVEIYREDVEMGQEDVESIQEDIDCDQEDVEIYREDVEMGQDNVKSVQEDIDCDQEDVEIYREDVEIGQEDVESVQEDIDCNQEDVEIYREDVEIGQEDDESVQEDIDCDQEDVEIGQENVESDGEDIGGIQGKVIERGSDGVNQDTISKSARNYSNVTDKCRSCRADCISEDLHVHYHCDVCNNHKHKSKSRVLTHVKKCLEKMNSSQQTKKLQQNRVLLEDEVAENKLQVVLVDPEKGIYLVRKNLRGPASPVHVLVDSNKGKMSCDNKECKEMATFSAHSLDPGAACRHIKSCQNAITEVGPDIFDLAKLCDTSFSKYSDDIKKIVEGAAVHQAPVAKIFLPDPKTDGMESTRHLYFSVFGNFSIQKYYSHFERVLLVFDRDTKKIKCYCDKDWCSHRKIVGAILESDKTLTSQRPEKVVDDAQVLKARKIASYLLENKRVPLKVNSYLKPKIITNFIPSEQ